MRAAVFTFLSLASAAFVENCGPKYSNQLCDPGQCYKCAINLIVVATNSFAGSAWGWCDIQPIHCDPETCLSKYSGVGSSCANKDALTTLKTSAKPSSKLSAESSSRPSAQNSPLSSSKSSATPSAKSSSKTSARSTTKSSTRPSAKPSTKASAKSSTNASARSSAAPPATAFLSSIPAIDICGQAEGGVSCPGAGPNGYFYRCCSSAGHCGPKNTIQDQSLYCGAGCQAGFGKCNSVEAPRELTVAAETAQDGETCGPIVNKKCASGLCCSGSNFCGTGESFCGAANWCQSKWGECSE